MKRYYIHSLELLELRQRKAVYVEISDRAYYVPWHHAMREVALLHIDLTNKSLLYTAQWAIKYGGNNGKLLAWLAKG